MKNIILIGPPGAGKGTLAKSIVEKEKLVHIATGDLIREEKKKGSSIGLLAERISDNGHFLPDNIVMEMVKQKVIDNSGAAGFIFDGFPRTVDQAKMLDEFLNQRKTPINKVVFLSIPNALIEKRLSIRAELEGRADDAPEVVKTRIGVYEKQTAPLVNYFENGYLFAANRGMVKVDASRTKEEVLAEVITLI